MQMEYSGAVYAVILNDPDLRQNPVGDHQGVQKAPGPDPRPGSRR